MLNFGEIGTFEQEGKQVIGFFDWTLDVRFEDGRDGKWRTLQPSQYKLLFAKYWITGDIDRVKPVMAKLYTLVDRQLVLVFQAELASFIGFKQRELSWMN